MNKKRLLTLLKSDLHPKSWGLTSDMTFAYRDGRTPPFLPDGTLRMPQGVPAFLFSRFLRTRCFRGGFLKCLLILAFFLFFLKKGAQFLHAAVNTHGNGVFFFAERFGDFFWRQVVYVAHGDGHSVRLRKRSYRGKQSPRIVRHLPLAAFVIKQRVFLRFRYFLKRERFLLAVKIYDEVPRRAIKEGAIVAHFFPLREVVPGARKSVLHEVARHLSVGHAEKAM